MDASIRYRGRVAIVEPSGRIVLGDGEAAFRGAIHRILDAGHSSVLVDLHRVEILDSCGIGALLGAQRSVAGRGGEIKLVHLSERVARILKITGVLDLFDVFEDEREAVESFGGRAS
jgi:anti-sigma B factor antagonist